VKSLSYISVVILLSLTQCAQRDVAARGYPAHHLSATAAPYQYDVKIVLTSRALAKLERNNEKIIFSAWYFGYPTPITKAKADDMGRITFNIQDIERNPALSQTFTVTDKAIDSDGLADIGDIPYLNINVVSARKSSRDNLLDCSLFEDVLPKPQQPPIEIQCDLIHIDEH
jgi:hypothetical protein